MRMDKVRYIEWNTVVLGFLITFILMIGFNLVAIEVSEIWLDDYVKERIEEGEFRDVEIPGMVRIFTAMHYDRWRWVLLTVAFVAAAFVVCGYIIAGRIARRRPIMHTSIVGVLAGLATLSWWAPLFIVSAIAGGIVAARGRKRT